MTAWPRLLLLASALLAAAPTARADATFAPRGRALVRPSPAAQPPPGGDERVLEDERRRRRRHQRRTTAAERPPTRRSPPRGGAAPASETTKELTGAAYFTVADVLLRRAFKAAGVAFPSQLGGSVILFLAMSLVQALRPGWGDAAFDLMSPGGAWLTRWMPVFFVPGLAMLPLAPSMGGGLEVAKVLGVVVIGFFYSVATTAFTVLGLRTMQGAIKAPEPEPEPEPEPPAPVTKKAAAKKPAKAAASKGRGGATAALPFSEETLGFLVKGTVLTGALSLAASFANNEYATPLQAVFMGFATFASYVWGARLPPAFTKIVHPLLTCTGAVLALSHLIGMATGSSFEEVLKSYKTGTLDPMKTGAGDVLLFMLGPAVVSFGLAMYSRRKLMLDNLLVVAAAIFVSSAGGLFGTAYFVKLIQLGGEAGRELRLSMLPRNVTTPLAIAIINLLGGNISIACSVVVLTGIFGATVGARVLSAMGVEDPVSRGLGIGAAAQGLGTASFAGEKDAFPFAALSMVLTALAATTLASFPAVKEALHKIVGDAAPKVLAEEAAKVVKEAASASAEAAASAASSAS